MRIVAVANWKGGVGKSCTALNLGAALADRGRSVLLVDLDAQQTLTNGLGVTSTEQDVGHALTSSLRLTSIIKETSTPNLYLVPAGPGLLFIGDELAGRADRGERLTVLLEDLPAELDYCIIDTPPSIGTLTLNALTAAQAVLIPTAARAEAMAGLLGFLPMLPDDRRVLILVTRQDRRSKHGPAVEADIRKQYRKQTLTTVIRESVALSDAAARVKTIFRHDKRSRGAVDYAALANEVERKVKP